MRHSPPPPSPSLVPEHHKAHPCFGSVFGGLYAGAEPISAPSMIVRQIGNLMLFHPVLMVLVSHAQGLLDSLEACMLAAGRSTVPPPAVAFDSIPVESLLQPDSWAPSPPSVSPTSHRGYASAAAQDRDSSPLGENEELSDDEPVRLGSNITSKPRSPKSVRGRGRGGGRGRGRGKKYSEAFDAEDFDFTSEEEPESLSVSGSDLDSESEGDDDSSGEEDDGKSSKRKISAQRKEKIPKLTIKLGGARTTSGQLQRVPSEGVGEISRSHFSCRSEGGRFGVESRGGARTSRGGSALSPRGGRGRGPTVRDRLMKKLKLGRK